MHERDLLLRVELLKIRSHLHADSATADNGDGAGVLDALLVSLEVLDGCELVVVLHGPGRLEARPRRYDEVVEGDFLRALPFPV